MGKITTPPYAVRYKDQKGWHIACWEHRIKAPYFGNKPSNVGAELWRVAMNASFQHGAVNAHMAKMCGYVPHISHVVVYRQSNGEIMGKAAMPMFEVV